MNEQSELDLNCFLDGFGTQRVPPPKKKMYRIYPTKLGCFKDMSRR